MFKYLTGLMTLALAACSTAPVIVPDTTKDNVVMKRLEWEIQNGKTPVVGWSWVLWYLPIVFLVVVWAYNQYLKKKCKEEETTSDNSTTPPNKP
jgi:hypothetical protein